MLASDERLAPPLAHRIGHWDGDPDTEHATWSEAMCAILDVPYEAGRSEPHHRDDFFARIHPTDQARARHELTRHYRDSGDAARSSFRLRLADGSVRYVTAQARMLRTPDGRPLRSLGVLFDETEHHRTSRQLDRMRRRLDRAAKITHALSRTLDPVALLEVGAEALAEIVGPDRISLAALVAGEPPRQHLLATLGRSSPAVAAGRTVPLDPSLLPIVRGEVSVLRHTMGASPALDAFLRQHGLAGAYSLGLPADGRVVGLLHLAFAEAAELPAETLDELTHIADYIAPALANALLAARMAERDAQLLHSQKLEAIGQLAAGVAHDFNNLLTVVQTSCTLLHHTLGRGPHTDDLEAIATATQRAAALTSKLLALGRQQLVQPNAFALDARIRAFAALLTRMLGGTVTLELHLEAPEAWVFMDPTSLEQVLVNLVVNARDAMPTGGTIHVRTAIREEGVHIVVADTGVGMGPEVQSRIFEPFFTTKGQERGSGLGLATTQGIVAQAGGSIALDSAPGRGTTFHIFLPPAGEALPESPDAPPSTRSAPPTDQRTILLVDDERLLLAAVKRLLEGLGYRVVTASDGAEALARATTAGRLDLLLTDVNMPGLHGLELARRLRAQVPDLPVVLMSGQADPTQLHELHQSGLPLLSKPFERSALERTLTATWASERPAPGAPSSAGSSSPG